MTNVGELTRFEQIPQYLGFRIDVVLNKKLHCENLAMKVELKKSFFSER
jgi:hypothetical protein